MQTLPLVCSLVDLLPPEVDSTATTTRRVVLTFRFSPPAIVYAAATTQKEVNRRIIEFVRKGEEVDRGVDGASSTAAATTARETARRARMCETARRGR